MPDEAGVGGGEGDEVEAGADVVGLQEAAVERRVGGFDEDGEVAGDVALWEGSGSGGGE